MKKRWLLLKNYSKMGLAKNWLLALGLMNRLKFLMRCLWLLKMQKVKCLLFLMKKKVFYLILLGKEKKV